MRFISDNVKIWVFQSEFNILFKRTYRFSGRYQCLAQAIQPDQTPSQIEHAPTRTRNLIKETKNQ